VDFSGNWVDFCGGWAPVDGRWVDFCLRWVSVDDGWVPFCDRWVPGGGGWVPWRDRKVPGGGENPPMDRRRVPGNRSWVRLGDGRKCQRIRSVAYARILPRCGGQGVLDSASIELAFHRVGG
jgi:hypothetical protein